MASVTPTSTFCIKRVCKPIDFSQDITLVEFGAGTGVFADYILERMTPGSLLVMFETNKHLFKKLKKTKDPRVQLFNRSVEHVADLLDERLIGDVDYIISGIPFSFLDDDVKTSILKQSKKILKKDGAFLAYQTSGHLKEPLQETFGKVETEFELLNIPPMTVYRAFK